MVSILINSRGYNVPTEGLLVDPRLDQIGCWHLLSDLMGRTCSTP